MSKIGIKFREYDSKNDIFTSKERGWELPQPPSLEDDIQRYAEQIDAELQEVLQEVQSILGRLGNQLSLLKEQRDKKLTGTPGNNGNAREDSDEIDNWNDIQEIFGLSSTASK